MVEELETKSKNALDFIKFRQSREINGIPTKFKGPFSEIIPAGDQNTTTIIAGRTGEGDLNCRLS